MGLTKRVKFIILDIAIVLALLFGIYSVIAINSLKAEVKVACHNYIALTIMFAASGFEYDTKDEFTKVCLAKGD